MVRRMLRGFYYRGDCHDPHVQNQIKKLFLAHLFTEFEKAELCVREGRCNLRSVRVKCGKNTDHVEGIKRHRRDVWEHAEREELELEFEITIDAGQELNDTEAVLQNFLETIQNLKWDEDFELETSTIAFPDEMTHYNESRLILEITNGSTVVLECRPGSVLNDERCVLCSPGTFYESSSKQCWDCPLAHYQEKEGQMECLKCDSGTSTEHRRSSNQTECKNICPPGTYSQTGLETCLACPLGTFQGHVGQRDCHPCLKGTNTFSTRSTSQDDCRTVCQPGSYSISGLAPCTFCSKGFFQSSEGRTVCQECPRTLSTLHEGSTNESDCIDIDPCAVPEICLNGGTCLREGRGAICSCQGGFEGPRCEGDINECRGGGLCLNAGICINTNGSFFCNCSDGFEGRLCEDEVDECLSSPCFNNGTCMDQVNGYECVCPVEYEGDQCEIQREICVKGLICLNGGVCIKDEANSSFCACPEGFSAVDCSMDIDECEDIICHNNGSCVDGRGFYECFCSPGFSGRNCETDINECEQNECRTGSTCRDQIAGYECICPPGWSGSLCDTKLDNDFVLHFPPSSASIGNMARVTPLAPAPMSDVTVSMWVQTSDASPASPTPMSYAVATATSTGAHTTVIDNALTVSDCSAVRVFLNGEPVVTDVQLADGLWHHMAFTWSSGNSGEWNVYKDGQLSAKGSQLRAGDVLESGGSLVLGQEQDLLGGGFSPAETFTGNISRVNVWNSFFSASNVTRLCNLDDDMPDKVVAWPDFLQGIEGNGVHVLRNQLPGLKKDGTFSGDQK